jgi:hypothetical protein
VTKWLSVTSKVTEQVIVKFQLKIYFQPLFYGLHAQIAATIETEISKPAMSVFTA